MSKVSDKRAGLGKKLSLTVISVLFCLLALAAAELACWVFLNINLRKTSKEFMIVDGSGRPIANAPNASGISFGAEVFSDANGYRVPKGYLYPEASSAVLLLGDSVTFGVGVDEGKTFAGILRREETKKKVLNAAVNGFSLPDHLRSAKQALASHPEIDEVYLFYCLNDFREIGQDEESKPDAASGAKSIKRAIASAFVWLNEFFGPRSKLYVLITGLTTDPSRRYYEWDVSLMNAASGRFDEVMGPVIEINRMARERGARFTVVLSPYEYQLRPGNGDFSPQDRIISFLNANDIRYLDTRGAFMELERPSEAFLFADPMHLSERGHRIVFERLAAFRRATSTN